MLKIYHISIKVAVFVVSSTGEGDPPENFEEFWSNLSTSPPTQLNFAVLGLGLFILFNILYCILYCIYCIVYKKNNVLYTVYTIHVYQGCVSSYYRDIFIFLFFETSCLGDSNYTEFGGFPRRLHQHLKNSGCNEFYEFALADDAVGLELVIEPWIEDLWEPLTAIIRHNKNLELSTHINLKYDANICKDPNSDDFPLVDLIFNFEYSNDSEPIIFPDGVRSLMLPFNNGKLEQAEIVSVKQLTSNYNTLVKETLEYEIATNETYSAGDSFGMLCHNSDQEVKNILNQLAEDPANANSSMNIEIKPGVKQRLVPKHFLNRSTAHYFLKYVFDLHALPKKVFLRYLAQCCSSTEEKNFLNFLASRNANEELKKTIYDQGLSLLDLLNMFPSCRPSIIGLLQFLPRLMPRYYSVSRITNEGTIKFVFNWIENKRKHEPAIPGVCTSYLKTLTCGDKVYVYKRKNDNFKPNSTRSMVLIGAGTGVSPFLGFLDHVYKHGNNSNVTLVTGNRYKNLDSVYREEFMFYLTKSVLTSYYAAHSRDEGCKHRYVQDIIRDYADFFVNKFDEGATVYVCGDAKGLGASVLGAFVEIISKRKYMSKEEAEAYIALKKKQGVYLEDIWT